MDVVARERGEAIEQITRSILELREIFADFAKIVQEQQVRGQPLSSVW
jgi:t-SNARE complex subunit (syntaxin)